MLHKTARIFCALSVFLAWTSIAPATEDFSLRDLGDGNAEIAAYRGRSTSLSIPGSIDGKRITSIGAWAFRGNVALKQVTLPESVTTIGEGAFANCAALENIAFPSALTAIASSAFFDCAALKSVALPDSLHSVGDEAFALCVSLEKVVAPKSLLDLGDNAFPLASKALYPESAFPQLEFVETSLNLGDPSGDSAIDGNESCAIHLAVVNKGKADAYGCRLKIVLKEENSELSFPSRFGIPKIPAGERVEVEIPISASRALAAGKVDFALAVDEPNGFGTEKHHLLVETRPFVAPLVKIVDYAVSGQGDSVLKKNQPFDLQLFLQNTTAGAAESVEVFVEFPEGVYLTDGEEKQHFEKLEGGDAKPLEFSLVVPRRYRENTIPIKVKIAEKYGLYAENWETTLKLNSTIATGKTVVAAQDVSGREIAIASFTSAVDKNIPVNPEDPSRNRFAVIVANENYRHGTAKVDFAHNDGKSFYNYCRKTLGIPESQVKLFTDATSGTMADALAWLAARGQTRDAELIFYYSGHGLPDETTRSSYLLPTDTSPSNTRYAQSLESVYTALGNSGARLASVFVDACFSGMRRDNAPIVAAKGVRLTSKVGSAKTFPPNLIVFTAASGDQTAHFAREERHGLFTYVLLKKLQSSRGDVSYVELKQYLSEEVLEQSLKLGDYEQTPSVLASEAFSSWEEKLYDLGKEAE